MLPQVFLARLVLLASPNRNGLRGRVDLRAFLALLATARRNVMGFTRFSRKGAAKRREFEEKPERLSPPRAIVQGFVL